MFQSYHPIDRDRKAPTTHTTVRPDFILVVAIYNTDINNNHQNNKKGLKGIVSLSLLVPLCFYLHILLHQKEQQQQSWQVDRRVLPVADN